MYLDKLMNTFGYSEMYEWSERFKFDIIPYGRFVTFDSDEPGKIRLCNSYDGTIGVTTINTVITSDNPEEWQGKYLCNEFGDIYLQENESNESITKISPVINELYNSELSYKKRSDRPEWIRVNLLGKCIVVDNGECCGGKYCTIGNDGIAIPCKYIEPKKYYVIGRLTENTIMIFFK